MAAPIRNGFGCLFQRPRNIKVSYCYSVFMRKNHIKSEQHKEEPTTLSHELTRNSQIDEDVVAALKADLKVKEFISYKRHAGIMSHKKTALPAPLMRAIRIVLEQYPLKAISEKSSELVTFILHRKPQTPGKVIGQKVREIEQKLLSQDPVNWDENSKKENEEAEENLRKEVIKELRKTVNHWKPLVFDELLSLVYLYGRTSFDFSVILQSLNEIKKRDPDFVPTSIYHNGSKVGAGVWASNHLWKKVGEHYCVDFSQDMNRLAQLLLEGGIAQNKAVPKTHINGVYFRRFEPSPKENKFPLIISPFMLIDLETERERKDHVLLLWEMTQDYLVLIETGNKAGYGLINEAREIILDVASQAEPGGALDGHTFAPCPHDHVCPKTLAKKLKPCVTDCAHSYIDPTVDPKTGDQAKIVEQIQRKPLKFARFSYVIFKKGPRKEDQDWPRVVGSLKRSGHTHNDLCLPCGQLQHHIIARSHDRHTFKCSQYTGLGDRLPVTLTSHAPAGSEVTQDKMDDIDQEPDEDTQI